MQNQHAMPPRKFLNHHRFLNLLLFTYKVHQVDRFGPLIATWKNKMIKQGWPYNKEDGIGSSA
jgi:hypothetical protein